MTKILLAALLLCAQETPACDRCGKPGNGTLLRWMGSPSEAGAKAKAEEKLVFLLHASGRGGDPETASPDARTYRLNALSNAGVAGYLNKHFVSAFQRIPTVHGAGVASYFCAPDGRVLHCIAGPVDAATLLREATWVVESVKKAMEESRATEVPFKTLFRRWHAERLRREHGLAVEPVTFDAPEPREDDPLSYRDPSGRPVLPVLVSPPIDGPDVQFRALAKEAGKAEADAVPDRRGCRWSLNRQGRVHQLMAAYALIKIEKIYATVFENILGQRIGGPAVDPGRPAVCLGCAAAPRE